MTKRTLSALLLLGTIACTQNQQDTIKSKETIVLSSTRIEKSLVESNGGRVSFVFEYLEEAANSPLSLADSTWETVRDSLLFYFDGPTDTDSLSHFLFQNYESIIADFPDYATPWYAEIVESEHYNSSNWLGLTLYVRSFMGGAHPNENFYFIHINPEKSYFYSSDSLFTEPDSVALLIKNQLQECGIEVVENPSIRNFRYSKDSVVFFYNPYEIAPYSEGPIEVGFSWEELKEHMN